VARTSKPHTSPKTPPCWTDPCPGSIATRTAPHPVRARAAWTRRRVRWLPLAREPSSRLATRTSEGAMYARRRGRCRQAARRIGGGQRPWTAGRTTKRNVTGHLGAHTSRRSLPSWQCETASALAPSATDHQAESPASGGGLPDTAGRRRVRREVVAGGSTEVTSGVVPGMVFVMPSERGYACLTPVNAP
jgi:hypothetical protein